MSNTKPRNDGLTDWEALTAIRICAEHARCNMPGKKAKGDAWRRYASRLIQDLDHIQDIAEKATERDGVDEQNTETDRQRRA